MTHSIVPAAALSSLFLAATACQQPVSTDDLAGQENSIEIQGQAAMDSENGTTGSASTAELSPTHPNGINFADPDPFIDYDTVNEEKGIEGDETD